MNALDEVLALQLQASEEAAASTLGERVIGMAITGDPGTHRMAFQRSSGVIWWLSADHVADFVGRHGALSAESYRARYAWDWEDDFFTGRGHPHRLFELSRLNSF